MSSQMTVYYANCTEKPTNCRYPNKIDIVDEATAKECFSRDYVCCEFKKHYRSNANFIKSNCIAVDIDNDHSDNPEDWITADYISQKLTDVTFAIHYSRNHMKSKGSKAARPRFHIIISAKEIMNSEECQSLKERLQRQLPFIDAHAIDTAHFFFGTNEPEVTYYSGSKTLEDFLDAEEANAYPEDNDTFDKASFNAYKVAAISKLGNTFVEDSHFDIEKYLSREFARRFGRAEEDVLING